MSRGRGRPTHLTDELLAALVAHFRGAATVEQAELVRAVPRATLYSWIVRGELEPGTPFGALARASAAARSEQRRLARDARKRQRQERGASRPEVTE